MTSFLFLLALLPTAGSAGLFNECAEKITAGTISFENVSDIRNWEVVSGSLAISSKRAKVGTHSCLWKWEKGGFLLMNNPTGLKRACEPYEGGSPEKYEPKYVKPGLEGGVKLWLYNESPSPTGRLFLQVGHDAESVLKNPRYRIPINLNFKGWRTIWVHFEQDAKVKNYRGEKEMNVMALVPDEDTSGALYIDWVNFVSYMSIKRHSDYQVTNHKPKELRYDSYVIKEYDEGLKRVEPAPLGEPEKKAFAKIAQRYEYLILGSRPFDALPENVSKSLKEKFRSGNKVFDQLGITLNGGILNGRPLFSSRDEHCSPDGMAFQKIGQTALFPMALECRLIGANQSWERLMRLFDFLSDQGFAAGSAIGTCDHFIRVNSFAGAIFLARKKLEERGCLEREANALAWFSMLGAAFNTPKNEGINTDLVRGGALPKLVAVLLMKDTPQKAGAMKGLVNYFNHVCSFAPGYSDTIKPDYSLYHHRSAYQSAYGVSTVTTMAIINWLLDGTVYKLSSKTKRILHNTLIAQLAMANKYDLHPGVCGRIQTRSALDRLLLPAYAFTDGMEGEFNRLYSPELNRLEFPSLSYSGTLGTMEEMERRVKAAGSIKVGPPGGHYTFPYAAYSTHRRDGWMAAVRGWSQYVWDFEAGSKHENDLGRYLSHGALFIIPETGLVGSHQDMDTGYHWAFLPGSTTKALPVEKTVFKCVPTPKYLEGKHRNYSDETFCGGVKLGRNGFFSMKLHDTVAPDDERTLFDDSFRAVKSYFFVDDKIYCMGTSIENNDERYHTITTLFQNTSDAKITIRHGVLYDVNGNAYVLINHPAWRMRKKPQKSWGKGGRPCEGPNVRAWIDHGKAPKNAGYEYMIAVQAGEKLPEVPFRVLQKDSTAHIISHENKKLTAFAVFEPKRFKGEGMVTALDTPLLLMTEDRGDTLALAVADPDLRLKKWGHNMSFMPREIVNAEARAHTARIILSGHWKLRKPVDGVRISHGWFRPMTTMRVTLQHGLTKEIELTK